MKQHQGQTQNQEIIIHKQKDKTLKKKKNKSIKVTRVSSSSIVTIRNLKKKKQK